MPDSLPPRRSGSEPSANERPQRPRPPESGKRSGGNGNNNDEDKPDPQVMERRARGVMLVSVLLLGGFVAMQIAGGARGAPTLRYDEFKQRVRDGQVVEVWLGPEKIAGRLRPAPPPTAAGASAGASASASAGSSATASAAADTRSHGPFGRSSQPDFETTRVPEDRELVTLLEQQHVRYSGTTDHTGWWITIGLSVLSVVIFVWFWRSMLRRAQSQQSGVLAFGKSKGRVAGDAEVQVRFEDVAGVEEAKEELREIVEFLRTPEKFTRLGAKIPKGVLLVGPPGTGKTLLAKAVAGEAGVPFFNLSGSEFVEMFVGVGAARVRDLFEQAVQNAPCIVFIDELDALGRSRGSNVVGTNEEREQTLNQLLVEMDGFGANKGVIIMGATNRPEILDPALLRPGRFDRQVLVDRPDRRGREAILKVHARGVKLAPEVDLGDLAARTPGFAGAELANIINEAALLAARKDKPAVTRADLSEAIDRVIAGLEKRSRIITPEERVRVAYHEAGHAIVGEVMPGAERTAKISIVPRGLGALGYTIHLPTEDRYIMTETELKSRLAATLGGRAAEREIFNDLSTGASDDLSRATELARAMVTDYGMSTRLGPVSLKGRQRGMFLGDGGVSPREHGENVTTVVDEEVRRIVDEAEAEARRILKERRPALERIAKTLIDKEYLDGDELRGLLVEARRPSMEPPPPSTESDAAAGDSAAANEAESKRASEGADA